MSELKKKRIRYEILEDIETWLENRIAALGEDMDYHAAEENKDENGILPEWRVDSIRNDQMKIAECRDIEKALLKL